MVNPAITKKAEKTLNVTTDTKKLFQAIYNEQNKVEDPNPDIPKIRVSELISKMAFYYEKIRNSVDYKEEHLLRKTAIERILKRHIIIEGAITRKPSEAREIAEHLLTELIRAAYLPNNKIPETKIDETAAVISKYLLLKKHTGSNAGQMKRQDRNELNNWIISLCASDIEEQLGRNEVDITIIDHMYDVLKDNIVFPENSPYEPDREIQIFIGIHRKLLKFDRDMLSFIMLKHYYPNWDNPDEHEISQIAARIRDLRDDIDAQLDHPMAKQLGRIIQRYTVFFTILRDVIEENPVKVYESFSQDPKAFPRMIKQKANQRYQVVKSKLWRAAVRSIVYIFITKSIFAVLLEVPATQFFGEELNLVSLAINVGFPAALLFVIVLFTSVPSDANTEKVIEGINEIVFVEHKRQEPFRLRKPVKRGPTLNAVFGLIYSITFILSFGLVIWILNRIGFNIVSIIIFLFFLAFVSFFSNRIRKNTKELIVTEPEENIFSFILDFFYVPIVSAGKWLSEKFSRINVFVFFLDFIIEAPFKVFVTIAEEWTKYVRERKEEIG